MTSAARPALSPRQAGALVVVAILWGASFLFIRVAVPALGPVALMALRMGTAGLLLLGWSAWLGQAPRREHVRRLLVLGALWAAPFTLIAAAELHLTAGLASVLNATTPLFAALVAAGALGERLSGRQAVGLVLGVFGVGLAVGLGSLTLSGAVLAGAGASLLAASLFAVGGVYAAKALRGVPPATIAAGQQLGGGVLLLPFAVAFPPQGPVDATVALSVAGLAVASTAVGFALFFRLVAEIGPTGALTTTYLVPVSGILWGAALLAEPVGWSLVAGLVVVLVSVGLVAGVPRSRLTRPRARTA